MVVDLSVLLVPWRQPCLCKGHNIQLLALNKILLPLLVSLGVGRFVRILQQLFVVVRLVPPVDDLFFDHVVGGQLIAQAHEVVAPVVRAAEQLDLAPARAASLHDLLDLVRLARCLAHFGHDHVAVYLVVELRVIQHVALHAHKAVFLGVVQPVASPARPDQLLVVGDLQPHDFVYPSEPPLVQAIAGEFHGASGDPEEYKPCVT